jgi:hypothetical protein
MAFTIQRLMDSLSISEEEAADVIAIVRGNIDPLEDDRFKKTQEWAKSCHNPPRKLDVKLEALNELLCGCGVEGLEHPTIYVDRYNGHFVASYVNFGDTYACTILHDNLANRFRLTSWGDFYESLGEGHNH